MKSISNGIYQLKSSNIGKKAVITVAASATIGMIASNNQSIQYAQAAKVSHAASMYLTTRQGVRMYDPDAPNDSISQSNADEMFAFSQIIANGGNPLQVAAAIESEQKAHPARSGTAPLDDDQAMAAFASYMAGDTSGLVDPAVELAKQQAFAKNKKAEAELQQLSDSDSTSALAGLVEVTAIEKKAEAYQGSAPEEDDEQPTKPLPAPKPVAAPAVNSKAKVASILAKLKKKADPPVPKVQAPKKVDQSLINSGAEIVVDQTFRSSESKRSKIQDVIDQLKGGMSVDQVRAAQKSGKKFSSSRPAAKAPKQSQAPIVGVAEEAEGLPPADEANIDAQAEDIIASIKSATQNLKSFDESGDAGEQTQALQQLLGDAGQVKTLADKSFVQLESDIQVEPELEMAMDYLSSQFPEDFPQEKVEKPKPKPLSEKEEIAKNKKEAVAYSQAVLEDATEYADEVKKEKDEKAEKTESVLEMAGMNPDADDTETSMAKKKIKDDAWKTANYKDLFLAQTASENHMKSSQKSTLSSKLKSKQKAKQKNSLLLDAEQLSFIDQYLNADSNIDEHAIHKEDLNVVGGSNADTTADAAFPSSSNISLLNSASLLQQGEAQTETQDMKSYSESIAKAADVVNKESDAYDLNESMSFTALKAQHMAAAKGEIIVDDSAKQADLDAKAAIVAQAEAANSAAIDSDPAPKKPDHQKQQTSQTAATINTQTMSTEEKQKQKDEQYKADKKSALDQGYTEEQADLYAKQEAATSEKTQQMEEQAKVQEKSAKTPTSAPASPPAQASTDGALSIQDQIKQAQEQQEAMKAKIEQNNVDKVGLPPEASPESIIAGANPEDLKAAQAALAQQSDPGAAALGDSSPNKMSQAEKEQQANAEAEQEAIKIYEQQEKEKKQAQAPPNSTPPTPDTTSQLNTVAPTQPPIPAPAATPALVATPAPAPAPVTPAAPVLAAAPVSPPVPVQAETAPAPAPTPSKAKPKPQYRQALIAAAIKKAKLAKAKTATPVPIPALSAPTAPLAPLAQPPALPQEAAPLSDAPQALQETAQPTPAPVLEAPVQQAAPQQLPAQKPPQLALQQKKLAPKLALAKATASGKKVIPNLSQIQQKIKAKELLSSKTKAKTAVKKPIIRSAPAKKALARPLAGAKPVNALAALKAKVAVAQAKKAPVVARKPAPPPARAAPAPPVAPAPAPAPPAQAPPVAVAQEQPPAQAPQAPAPVLSPPQPEVQVAQAAVLAEAEETPVLADAAKPTVQELGQQATPAPAPVAAPAPVPAKAPAPAQPPAALPQKPRLTAKQDKQELQQAADIHGEEAPAEPTPPDEEQIKLKVADDRKRADKYSKDLNKARDEITKAQEEMKSIDTEVTNFHQKMAKSMHALLQAFDEGFQAMDKAKKEEAADVQVNAESAEVNTKRVKKLDKIHSSISNLEALTSKLKLSFDDAPEKPDQNVQTQEDIVAEPPKEAEEQVKQEQPAIVAEAQAPVPAAPAAPAAPAVQVAQAAPVKPQPLPQEIRTKMVSPTSKNKILQALAAQKKSTKTTKMVSPKAATKVLNLKKINTAAGKHPVHAKAPSGTALKAKMKALLAANQKKLLAQKAGSKKPLGLAQTSSTQEVENFAKALTQSDLSLKLQNQLKSIQEAFGFNKKEQNKLKSQAAHKLLADSMANRVMVQLKSGKKKEEVAKDLHKTKQSLILAQKAYFEKHPDAIEFIQTGDKINLDESDKVYLITDTNSKSNQDPTEDLQIEDVSAISTSPEESEESVQVLMDADAAYADSVKK